MPSWMAWVQRPSGLIKMEGSGSTFKVENVSWKQISIIDLIIVEYIYVNFCS